jgi:hypothetical protein
MRSLVKNEAKKNGLFKFKVALVYFAFEMYYASLRTECMDLAVFVDFSSLLWRFRSLPQQIGFICTVFSLFMKSAL